MPSRRRHIREACPLKASRHTPHSPGKGCCKPTNGEFAMVGSTIKCTLLCQASPFGKREWRNLTNGKHKVHSNSRKAHCRVG